MPSNDLIPPENQPKSESQTPSISLPEAFKLFEKEKVWLCSNAEKLPVSPVSGISKGYNSPENWGDYASVTEFLKTHPDHSPAIMMGSHINLTCIDLDHVIDQDGNIASWAKEIVELVDSYTEVSSGGCGLHIFVSGTKNGNRVKGTYKENSIEIYGSNDSHKPIKLTGNIYHGKNSIQPAQNAIDRLYEKFFPAKENIRLVHGLKALT